MLIPCKVKYPDLVALRAIVDILRELKQADKATIIFNDIRKPHSKTYREIKDLFLSNYTDIKKANTELTSLVSFTKVFAKPLEGQAFKEVKSLVHKLNIIQI